jgi:predicted DNA-binding transcriptional regulator YafY
MTLRDKLKRCELILRYLRGRQYKTQQEIIDYVADQEGEFMDRDSSTIESGKEFGRLLKTIEREFGIQIKYNTYNRMYTIVTNEEDDLDDPVELYYFANSVGFSASSLNELRKMKNFIQVSNTNSIGQTDHISKLLGYCIHSKEVIFEHRKYGESESKSRKVEPYQLREFQGRWYLIGIEPDKVKDEPHPEIIKFRYYELDRMQNLKEGETFIRDKWQEFRDHYTDVIGIVNGYHYQTGTNIDPEEIRMRVSDIDWEYIKALPWHHTQEEIIKSDGFVDFKLEVKPTSELVQLILQWSPKVKVIEPQALRENVLAQLEKSMSLYNEIH